MANDPEDEYRYGDKRAMIGLPPLKIEEGPFYIGTRSPSFNARFTPLPKPRPAQGEEKSKPARLDHTYLIAAEGSSLVKIGYASNPARRLQQLQCGQPMQLTLAWSCEGNYEDELHARFARHRVRGEWFDLTPLGDPLEVVQAAVQEAGAAQPAHEQLPLV